MAIRQFIQVTWSKTFSCCPSPGTFLHSADRFGDQMISVRLKGGDRIPFSRRRLVWVWGTFRASCGDPSGPTPLYYLENARAQAADRAVIGIWRSYMPNFSFNSLAMCFSVTIWLRSPENSQPPAVLKLTMPKASILARWPTCRTNNRLSVSAVTRTPAGITPVAGVAPESRPAISLSYCPS
jgi:hypothetical protein